MVCDIFMRRSTVGQMQTGLHLIQTHCNFHLQENTPRSHQIYCYKKEQIQPVQ